MPYRRLKILASAVGISLCPPLWAVAETSVDTETTGVRENIVVTGTRIPASEHWFASQLTVVGRDTIAGSNALSVSGLLQRIAGLHISQQGGAGGVSNLYMNGAESNFTLVLLNGIQLNDPTSTHGGAFDFSDLDINSIERIEIIRGPQSAVYGSDALAGVVNIITLSGDSSAHFTVGDHGQRVYGYQFASSSGENTGLGLSLKHLDSGDLVAGHSYDSDSLNGRFYADFGEKTKLEASLHYLSAERTAFPQDSGGPLFALADDVERGDKDNRALGIKWTHTHRDNWVVEVFGQWFNQREKADSPGIAPFNFVPPNGRDSDFTRKQWTLNNRLRINAHFDMSLGADLRRESGSSIGYLGFSDFVIPTRFDVERDIRGFFAEGQYRKNAWVLNASTRRDSGDGFDSDTTSKLVLGYQVRPGIQLYASWGQGFKLPSFFALGDSLTGNPALRPEKSDSLSIGLKQQGDNIDWDFSWYRRKFTDLVDFDPVRFTSVNRSSVEVAGVDLQVDWTYSKQLGSGFFISYNDVDNVDSGTPLRGRPEWKAGVTGSYRLNPQLKLHAGYLWVDRVYESSLVTGLIPLDDYSTLDLSLSWDYSSDWSVGVAVNNVLDKRYQQAVGTPSPTRHGRLTVRYHF